MSDWRQIERPTGFQDYQRWFRPEGLPPRFGLSDIDGFLHTRNFGSRFLMFEFKPTIESLTTGQRITLDYFSRMDGCASVLIAEGEYWQDKTGTRIEDDEQHRIQVWLNGEPRDYLAKVSDINAGISDWYLNGGFFVHHPLLPQNYN